MVVVTKSINEVKGYIEYSWRPTEREISVERISEDDLEDLFESDIFYTLQEMLEKIKPEVLERIKTEYAAANVWISNITFMAESEDKVSSSNIMFSDTRVSGHLATEINNDDIDTRLLLNLNKIKQIIDNTLHQYPISYK